MAVCPETVQEHHMVPIGAPPGFLRSDTLLIRCDQHSSELPALHPMSSIQPDGSPLSDEQAVPLRTQTPLKP